MITVGLTVGKLRAMLSSVPDDVVVAIVLDPSTPVSDQLTTYHQVAAEYSGGPVFKLRPTTAEWCSMDLTGAFFILGRGLAVPLSDPASSKVIPGTVVEVDIRKPDGTTKMLWASVELTLSHVAGGSSGEVAALLLRDAPETGFPEGTFARFRGAA